MFVVLLVIVTGIAIPIQIAFVREVTLGGSALVYLLDLVFLVDIGFNFSVRITLNLNTFGRQIFHKGTNPHVKFSRYFA